MSSPRCSHSQTILLSSRAPCRVCLFGEHQDYLGFPVIAASIPVFVEIQGVLMEGSSCERRRIELIIPSLSETPRVYDWDDLRASSSTHQSQDYNNNNATPDFCLAALLQCQADGWEILKPGQWLRLTSTVTDDMPMRAGCSTSSAFLVALIRILAWLSNKGNHDLLHEPIPMAQRAFHAEVTHWGAPGGTMDHIACSVGHMVRIGANGMWHYERLLFSLSSYSPAALILADSGEPKDTWKHLHRCKNARMNLLHDKLNGDWDTIAPSSLLSSDEQALLKATLTNRQTEEEAYRIFQEINQCHLVDENAALRLWKHIGDLMNQHHAALRDTLNLSTDRLEVLRSTALNAGAWGFKVVGSGGGGCGIAIVPASQAPAIRDAMTHHARKIWIISSPGPTPTLSVSGIDGA